MRHLKHRFYLTLVGLSAVVVVIHPSISSTTSASDVNLIDNVDIESQEGISHHVSVANPFNLKSFEVNCTIANDLSDNNADNISEADENTSAARLSSSDQLLKMVDGAVTSTAVANSKRSYDYGYGVGTYPVDFSPLFLALIPIALFLGAAAAFALSVATASSTAVATAQQQQQQEESSNNNNAANSNNNNALLAALLATSSSSNRPTFIVINNNTFPYFFGRALSEKFQFTLPWRRHRRRSRRNNRVKPKDNHSF